MPTNYPGWISQIEVLPDGRIYVSGAFLENSANAPGRNGLARLNSDGTLDLTFNPTLRAQPAGLYAGPTFALQADGKLIVALTRVFTYAQNPGLRSPFRLDAHGSLDNSFVSSQISNLSEVSKIIVLPDGKVLVAGSLVGSGVRKLSSTGGLDTNFNANIGSLGDIEQFH